MASMEYSTAWPVWNTVYSMVSMEYGTAWLVWITVQHGQYGLQYGMASMEYSVQHG
jgi:hypothetical protein